MAVETVFRPLVAVFTALGWTRDDAKWMWTQIGALAMTVLAVQETGLRAAFAYVQIPIGDAGIHRILAGAVLLALVGGKMSMSQLTSRTPPAPPAVIGGGH